MKSFNFSIKIFTIGLLIIVIVFSTLILGFSFLSNSSPHINSYLTINSISVSKVSQSDYNRNAYYYPAKPPPAKVIYGLTFQSTIFLNQTYSFNIWRANIGLCTFHPNFVNSSGWEFVPFITSCPITDQYNAGNTSFTFYRQIIPSNYNASITYPIQLTLTASSNDGFPISVISQPFILQINN